MKASFFKLKQMPTSLTVLYDEVNDLVEKERAVNVAYRSRTNYTAKFKAGHFGLPNSKTFNQQ